MAKFLSFIPKYTKSRALSAARLSEGCGKGRPMSKNFAEIPHTAHLLQAEHAAGAWGYQGHRPELFSLATFSPSWTSKLPSSLGAALTLFADTYTLNQDAPSSRGVNYHYQLRVFNTAGYESTRAFSSWSTLDYPALK